MLAQADFRSGSDLAAELGISRTAVWKKLKALSEIGLEFSAVSGRGYRLTHPLELLDETRIMPALDEAVRDSVGIPVIHDRIRSTNQFLIDRYRAGETGPAVCLAESQSAGRGRSGRTWVSPFGCNIYLSVSWVYQSGPGAISGLSLAAGVAVMRVLEQFNIAGAGLKWPNDILWEGRKLGGILVEVSGDAHGPCLAVVGLGLNLYLSREPAADIDQPWVDLHSINAGQAPGRNALVAALLNRIVPVVSDIDRTGLEPYLREWRQWDCMTGKEAVLHLGEQTIRGEVDGINDDGRIRFVLESGEIRTFSSGEVSFSAG